MAAYKMSTEDKNKLNELLAMAEKNLGKVYQIVINGLKFSFYCENVWTCFVYEDPNYNACCNDVKYNKKALAEYIQWYCERVLPRGGRF